MGPLVPQLEIYNAVVVVFVGVLVVVVVHGVVVRTAWKPSTTKAVGGTDHNANIDSSNTGRGQRSIGTFISDEEDMEA